jgi:hypothetical protein
MELTALLPLKRKSCYGILRKEHTAKVFDSRMLIEIFGLKSEKMTEEKLHNEELHNLYFHLYLQTFKSRRMGREGCIERKRR